MHHHLLGEILILLAVSVVGVAVFRRLNLTPVLAYLLVGMIVGPHGLGWIPDTETTRFLAEFGVVFLLFTLGLEFSLPKLFAMRKAVLGLGSAQVIISLGAIATVAWSTGLSLEAAFVVGSVMALSSTAIVIKQLREQLELNSRHGRSAVGVLLFQDLAVIPLLIIIPTLSGTGENSVATELAVALVKGLVVTGILFAVGYWLLRPLFHEVARAHSAELFTLTVLLVALLSAWATQAAGLSMALGAFLAGIMLSETEFRHQIEADIRPFRDVLLGLFFITIGMLLNLQALPDILGWVLLVTGGLILFKMALITGLCRAMGDEPGVSLRTGLVLAQGGEFGFALIALGLQGGLLDDATSQVVLASVILSMVASPFLIRHNGNLAKWLFRKSYVENRESIRKGIQAGADEMEDHIIICGFGRTGQNVARFAEEMGMDTLALELDPAIVRTAREAGHRVFYADSTHQEILRAAGVERAQALIITHHDCTGAIKTVSYGRSLSPSIPILVRTATDKYMNELLEAGATEVVPDVFEASLMLSSHLLYRLGLPLTKIVQRTQAVREDHYRLLRHVIQGQETDSIEAEDRQRQRLHTVTIPAGARAVGRSLGDIDLEELDVSVDAIRRHGIKGEEPQPETILAAQDTLILYGTPEDLEQAENRLLKG